jgi:hypothetical protein
MAIVGAIIGLTGRAVNFQKMSPGVNRQMQEHFFAFEIGSTVRPCSPQASSPQVGFDWVCFCWDWS